MIDGVGNWTELYPTIYLKDLHLKYLGWALSDQVTVKPYYKTLLHDAGETKESDVSLGATQCLQPSISRDKPI